MAFGLYGLSALGSGTMKGMDDAEESRLRQAKLMMEKQAIEAAQLDLYENREGGNVLLKYPDLATSTSPFATPQRPTPSPGVSSTAPPTDDPAYTIPPSQAARVNAPQPPPPAPTGPGGPNIPAAPGGPGGPGPVGPVTAGPQPPPGPQPDPNAPIVPRPVQTERIGPTAGVTAEGITAMPGGADLRRIIEKIRESNPNIKPEAMFGILNKMNKVLSPESKQLLEWMKYQLARDKVYGANTDLGSAKTAFDMQPGQSIAGYNQDAIIDAARRKMDTGRYPVGLSGRTGSALLRALIDNTAAAMTRDPDKLAKSPDVVGHMQDVEAAKTAALAGPRAGARALGDLTVKKVAIEAFEETALKNYEGLVKLADKVDYSGIPVLQRWIKGGMKAVKGDTDVNNFDFQVRALKAEVAKIIYNPNLTGVLTDDARREIDEALGPSTTPAMIRALGPVIKQDITNRKDALEDGIEAINRTLQGYRTKSGTPGATRTPSTAPATPGGGTIDLGGGATAVPMQ